MNHCHIGKMSWKDITMHLPTHLFGFNFFKKYFFNELETNNYIPTHKKKLTLFLTKTFLPFFLKWTFTINTYYDTVCFYVSKIFLKKF
jgi:hypothetical protein